MLSHCQLNAYYTHVDAHSPPAMYRVRARTSQTTSTDQDSKPQIAINCSTYLGTVMWDDGTLYVVCVPRSLSAELNT